MSTFAERFLDCIERRATNQAEVARKAHVSAASISDWARGVTGADNIKAEPLLRAAAFLQVNPMWLLTGRGSRAGSLSVVHVEQPEAPYSAWPFGALNWQAISQLKRDDLLRLEGAWLHAAGLLGFSLGKRDAA